MAFSLSNWLLRRKIGAHVRQAGGHVEHRRIGNPYHAVSIEPGARACRAARDLDGRRFLSGAAPQLPLKECASPACHCRYQHHNDRRVQRDRRVQPHNPHAHRMSDRRISSGRRISD